jgi:hypothetical protein
LISTVDGEPARLAPVRIVDFARTPLRQDRRLAPARRGTQADDPCIAAPADGPHEIGATNRRGRESPRQQLASGDDEIFGYRLVCICRFVRATAVTSATVVDWRVWSHRVLALGAIVTTKRGGSPKCPC